uniref:DNA polymerase III subunit delta n=1 Tax=Thaumasiovibrio occultus TaxID=1891184 RepID=UPI000B34BB42|nr:DNA polymerase III subunit delta [Thaumasiovibrio occultus]
MRVFPEQLATRLEKSLQQSYLLFGNEPLLKIESNDAIVQLARTQGFEEKHYFTVNNQLDWNEVFDCCQALSLFSQRQILILELPDSGVNATIAKQLLALAELLHDDILLILIGPRATKAQENAKWFKALTQNGLWVPCNTPEVTHLPRFVERRCQMVNLRADRESIQMLAQWHEGNLLALAQSIEKLALLYPDGQLTVVRLTEALSRHNHFTPFQLVDAILAGQTNRVAHVLKQQQAEGVEAVIILRTVQKVLFELNQLQEAIATNGHPQGAFERLGIWQQRRPLYQGALQRLTRARTIALISELAALEMQVKTSFEHNVWPKILHFSLGMCGLSMIDLPN